MKSKIYKIALIETWTMVEDLRTTVVLFSLLLYVARSIRRDR